MYSDITIEQTDNGWVVHRNAAVNEVLVFNDADNLLQWLDTQIRNQAQEFK